MVVGPVDPMAELSAQLASPGALWLTEEGRPLREHPLGSEGFVAVLSESPTVPARA